MRFFESCKMFIYGFVQFLLSIVNGNAKIASRRKMRSDQGLIIEAILIVLCILTGGFFAIIWLIYWLIVNGYIF